MTDAPSTTYSQQDGVETRSPRAVLVQQVVFRNRRVRSGKAKSANRTLVGRYDEFVRIAAENTRRLTGKDRL